MPPGLECFKGVRETSEKCIPCTGIYFHVERDEDFRSAEESEEYKAILEKYKEYKLGFSNRTEGKQLIIGAYYFIIFCLQGYYVRTKLNRIKIYFNTPTFLLITKDEKANFEDKLSAVGGTMGLLTGFSLISGVEIIYFGFKIAFKFIKKTIKKDKTTIV